MTTHPLFKDDLTASTTTNSGSLTFTLPAGMANNDYVVVVVGVEGVRSDAVPPSGWTVLGRNDTNHTSIVLGKRSDGTDSFFGATVTFPTSATAAAMGWVFTGVDPATDPEISVVDTGIKDTINPNGVTASWGADNNLFLAIGTASDDGATVNAWPTGYTVRQQQMTGGGGTNNDQTVAIASRELTVATDNPSLFNLSELEAVSGWTVVLRPAPDPPPAVSGPSGQPGGASFGDDSAVVFTPAEGHVEAGVEIVVDWDGDGDFDRPEENITDLVLGHETQTGRDLAAQYRGVVSPGRLRMQLRNDDARFSLFNDSSVLRSDGFSIDQGHKVRVQVAGTVQDDPVRLAGDRFLNGFNVDEVGNTWVDQTNGGFTADDGQGVVPRIRFSGGERSVATVPVGVSDGVVFTHFDHKDMEAEPGIVYRWTDVDNHGLVVVDRSSYNLGRIQHWYRSGGGSYVLESEVTVEDLESATLYVEVEGTQIRYGYGGEIFKYATAYDGAGTDWGMYCIWRGNVKPRFREFQMWDKKHTVNPDVLWTGRLSSVKPSGDVNGLETAVIEAEGFLAAAADVDATGLRTVGTGSGISWGSYAGAAAGEALRQAGLLHPPGPIYSDHTVGSDFGTGVGVLELLRKAEQAEQGRIYETPEGPVGLRSRGYTDGVVWSEWSDSGDAQFRFETVDVRDYRGDLVNRADATVSAAAPFFYVGAGNQGAGPVGAEISIAFTMPNLIPFGTQPGELMFIVFTSSVHDDDVAWQTPPGWVALLDPGSVKGKTGVYVKVLTEYDLVQLPSWTFYKDTARPGGSWIYQYGVVRDWYGSIDGGVSAVSRSAGDGTSGEARTNDLRFPTLEPAGGVDPHLFMACLSGVDASTNNGFTVANFTDETVPHRYYFNNTRVNSEPDHAHSSAYTWGIKYGVSTSETPSGFDDDFLGFDYLDAVCIGVRGKPRFTTTLEDHDSQARVGAIKSWDYDGTVFPDSGDADGANGALLASYSRPTPTLEVSFTATKRGDYRAQAVRRRVGDRIHVSMVSGAAAGIDGVFSIESVAHSFDQGAKRWTCKWGLAAV